MLAQKYEMLFPRVQKPARYIGGEPGSIVKDKSGCDISFAFCFPDTYEIGMSHLGMKILYSLINSVNYALCERVFAPAADMEALLRENGLPLFSLETRTPLSDFDIIGFTLQYELSYTNILNMLDLSGIPLRSKERTDVLPLIIAGGPCACNPEPLADFFDVFVLGEGEEVTLELLDVVRTHKDRQSDKRTLLKALAQIQGVYVPSLYEVSYDANGVVREVKADKGVPSKVTKRVIADLDNVFYPENFPVPFIEIVHDRAVHEIFRGCIRGCRFCQAGFIYRPAREKSISTISRQSRKLCGMTGYDELSLCSLSSSDYTKITELLTELLSWTTEKNINIALPSLRIDGFSEELTEKLSSVRRAGLTFAPEAGTQRLRDVINKNVTGEEVLKTSRKAFGAGWNSVKLYFMLGLPTETDEDIRGIAALSQAVVDEFYNNPDKPKGKGVTVSVSASTFVPKPFTPFQWEGQDTSESILNKQKLLRNSITTRKIALSAHGTGMSLIEAVLARGDRRLSAVIETAYRSGCIFDSWDDSFYLQKWLDAFKSCGLQPEFYANRTRPYDEVLPWDHLDYGIDKAFLIRESEKARAAIPTKNCREQCSGCGANALCKGVCDENR